MDAHLVVPTNQFLIQCRRPYITRGQVIPYTPEIDRSEASSRWGGLEIDKDHQLYPIECMDGQVQHLAATGLSSFLKRLPLLDSLKKIKCMPGQSVQTPSFGIVEAKSLIHTAIPYRNEKDALAILAACYVNSAHLVAADVASSQESPRIVTSLLGSGSRGFRKSDCAFAAHLACTTIAASGRHLALEFAVRDKELLDQFLKLF